jgi:predicted secreted protein
MAFTSEILDGVNLLLSIDGTPIGASSSCSVELTRATRNTSNKDTGIWDSYAAGSITWSMSSENFVNFGGVNGYDELFDAMVAGTPVEVSVDYKQDASNTWQLSGEAIITGLPLSAPKGENVSFSVSLQGSGKLKRTKTEETEDPEEAGED